MPPAPTKPDESTTGRHIPALDGLRGLAVLLVLMCHLLWSNPNPEGGLLVRMLAHIHAEGWVGVSLFFVLSGFLITGILYDTLPDAHFFRNFYARRSLRIFPLYYGFIFLLFLITRFTGDHWLSGIVGMLTYTSSLHLSGGTPYTDAAWINLNHFWSLAIEEQFYLVWPLLVFFLRARRRIVIVAACGMALSFLTRVAVALFTNMEAHPYALQSWTPSQLDGLFFGAILAIGIRSGFRSKLLRLAMPLFVVGTTGILAIWVHNGELQIPGHNAALVLEPLLLALAFGGLLLGCLQTASRVSPIFAHPVMRFFGKYSYGLYVYHYTLAAAVLTPMRTAMLARGQSKMLSLLLPAAIVLLLSVAAAWLSFRYFEAPFLRLKDRFTNHAGRARLADVVPLEPTAT